MLFQGFGGQNYQRGHLALPVIGFRFVVVACKNHFKLQDASPGGRIYGGNTFSILHSQVVSSLLRELRRSSELFVRTRQAILGTRE